MATKITKDRNYAAIYALLKKLPYADKASIVYEWTGGRTESLREMTDKEYHRMIAGLNNALNDQTKLKDARSKALHQLQLYGIDTTDWDVVNRFVSQPRIAGKVFYKLSIAELTDLTRKMRAIIAKPRRQRSASSQTPVHKPSYIVVHRSPRGEG